MSEWIKSAQDILSGKAKGSKLIVIGILLILLAIVVDSMTNFPNVSSIVMLALMVSAAGVSLYASEAHAEIEAKRARAQTSKQEEEIS